MTKGTLFLCATPIGNLNDMTFRLVETLKEVDIVAAEDTSHSIKLLNHIGVNKKMVSYHEHNKDKTGPKLIEILLEGKNIALLSDAGFPAIADPGEDLVKLALEHDITIVPVPGANAALCALIASGITTTPFFFAGFLPKTKKNRVEKLAEWKAINVTIIFYEAPHRIEKVLEEIFEVWGNRKIVLARELTKKYEEFFRGNIKEALLWLREKPPKGEFSVVIEGNTICEDVIKDVDPLDKLIELISEGGDKKECMKTVAKMYNIPKREIYNRYMKLEAKSQGSGG